MGSTFSHSGKHRNRQPDGGASDDTSRAAGLIDLDAALAEFPKNIAYRVCDGDLRDRINLLIGRLLAEEIVAGPAATLKVNRLCETLRADVTKSWHDSTRKAIELAQRGGAFLVERSDEIASMHDCAQAAAAELRRAEQSLAESERRRDAAKIAVERLERLAFDTEQARAAVAPSDPIHVAALEHLRRLGVLRAN